MQRFGEADLVLVQACPGLLIALDKAENFLKREKYYLVTLKRPRRNFVGTWQDYWQRQDESVAPVHGPSAAVR